VFMAALSDMRQVIRDITLTNVFEIKTAKKIRKLALGEILEAVGTTQEDSTLELERLQCRAVSDGATGWVTVKSKNGASYLKRAVKPFLWCADSVPLRRAREESSGEVRELGPGEVLELIEGPHEGRPGEVRVRGIACHEQTAGWLHLKDTKGTIVAEVSDRVYKCVEPIAMTQEPDFSKCTMVRRIDAGEALELCPDEEFEPSAGTTRKRFRACTDGKEGWITTSGNKGKVYLTPAKNHYICLKATPVHVGLGAESAVARVLMPGEAFAAVEEPREVSGGEKLDLYRVRAIMDSAEGWVASSSHEAKVQKWSTRYKALKPVTLTAGLLANEAAEVVEVLRLLETDELLDIAEHPTLDTSTGQLRARCVALKDKLVGWVTVRDTSGGSALNVRPVGPGEGGALPEQKAVELAEPAERPPSTKGTGKRAQKRLLDQREQEQQHDDEGDQGKGGRGRGRGQLSWQAQTGRVQPQYAGGRVQPYYAPRYDGPPAKRWKGSGRGKW